MSALHPIRFGSPTLASISNAGLTTANPDLTRAREAAVRTAILACGWHLAADGCLVCRWEQLNSPTIRDAAARNGPGTARPKFVQEIRAVEKLGIREAATEIQASCILARRAAPYRHGGVTLATMMAAKRQARQSQPQPTHAEGWLVGSASAALRYCERYVVRSASTMPLTL